MLKKICRTISKWSVLGLSLTSMLFSFALVCSPRVGAWGGASAVCKDGSTVKCQGFKCSGTDNVGCTCFDSAGKVEDTKPCPKPKADDEGFLPVENDS